MSADHDSGAVLPVRTSRYRRIGRHSSPHQLSLPSDSPALVIAVPGSARPESDEIAVGVADMAATSCHGAEIRIGYLRGNQDHLEDVLADLASHEGSLAGVVVPLYAFPNPEADRAISDAVAAAEAQLLIADHLGPHPLLAEALHARLADVGLARASRVGRISIVTEQAADGVIVGAVGGDEAVQAAEVVAVLLASRLTTPVAAASLNDPGSIKDAAAQLRRAVPRVALAPCMVGPELTPGTLEAIAALTSTECAAPLGGHPAVGQLVAIRYGAALAAPGVASMVAEAKGGAAAPPARARKGAAPPAPAPPAGSAAVFPAPTRPAAGGRPVFPPVAPPDGTGAAPPAAPTADGRAASPAGPPAAPTADGRAASPAGPPAAPTADGRAASPAGPPAARSGAVAPGPVPASGNGEAPASHAGEAPAGTGAP
jgi:hypothetical protein